MLNFIKDHIAEAVISQGQLHNGETDRFELQQRHTCACCFYMTSVDDMIIKGLRRGIVLYTGR